MGELVLKHGNAKSELFQKFLSQTESYLKDLESESVSSSFRPTLDLFIKEFTRLKAESINPQNQQLWAERSITWGDILQIRSKLV